MGQTNIHTPMQILTRAGQRGRFTDQATIKPFDKPVLISSGTFTQDDVDRYAWCLKSAHVGCWIVQDSAGQIVTTSADEELNVPEIRVGPGLASSTATDARGETRFVLVVEGKSGACRVKVLVESSVEAAAAVMLREAINGYSTAFCAAYLRVSGGEGAGIPQTARLQAVAEFEPMTVERGAVTVLGLVCCV